VSRKRRFNPIFTQTSKLKLDGALNSPNYGINRFSSSHASRQVRDRRSPITIWIFVDTKQILQFFHRLPLSPDSRMTDASVVICRMTTYGHAPQLRGVLELPVTAPRYY